MKIFHALFSILILAFLIFSATRATTAAQTCNTGADKPPCDGKVNITELTDYIDAWYSCSACVPDLFQAIEAYYGITHVPDPCAGITECSDYTDSENCTINPCGVGGGCEWNSTLGVCAEAPLPANTYYVSPAGNGSHTGLNPENAMNLSQAQTEANSKTDEQITFLLLNGDYGDFVWDGTERSNWVRYGADKDDNGKPVFSRIILYYSRTDKKDAYVSFDGIAVRVPMPDPLPDPDDPDTWEGTGNAVQVTGANHVEILNCNITGAHKHLTGYVAEFYNSNEVRIHNCEGTVTSGGIHFVSCNGFVCSGNKVHDMAQGSGIRIEGDTTGGLIENNHVHRQYGSHDDDYFPLKPSHWHPGSGISIRSKNLIIRNNTINSGFAQGTMFYGDFGPFYNMTVENNLFYDTWRVALGQISEDVVIRNNTFIGRFRDIKEGSRYYPWRYQGTLGIGFAAGYDGSGVKVYNNIIRSGTGWPDSGYQYQEDDNIAWRIYDTQDIRGQNTIYLYGGGGVFPAMNFENAFFVNAPKFCDWITSDYGNYSGAALGEEYEFVTITHAAANFSDLRIIPGYSIEIINGADALGCYDGDFDDCDLRVRRVEGSKLTLFERGSVNTGSQVDIRVHYSPSTKSKIYVSDNTIYGAGDVIDYDYKETPHNVIGKGKDDEGYYITISPPLDERARAPGKGGGYPPYICNWGKAHYDVARDFRPLMSSPACNGSVNPPGVAVGAFPCADPDCEDKDGDGYYAVSEGCPPGNDCDDSNPSVHYRVPEICGDGLDNDCSGGDLQCTPAGLVLYLRMDNNLSDSSGYESHGEWRGAEKYNSAGKSGQALGLDGANCVYIPDLKNTLRTPDDYNFTISVWVKTDDISKSGQQIFNAFDSYPSIRISGTNFRICQDSGNCRNFGPISEGEWYHVAVSVVWSSWSVYLNGSLKIDSWDRENSLDEYPEDYKFYTGGGEYGCSWDGLIDELRIYNKALNKTGILEIYNGA